MDTPEPIMLERIFSLKPLEEIVAKALSQEIIISHNLNENISQAYLRRIALNLSSEIDHSKYADLASYLRSRHQRLGKDRIANGGAENDQWTELDNHSCHIYIVSEGTVLGGLNIHAMRQHNQLEYWISRVFTHKQYEGNGVATKLLRYAVDEVKKVDPNANIYLNSRCPHKDVPSHSCRYPGNTDSRVGFYEERGFSKVEPQILICAKGIGTTRMKYTGLNQTSRNLSTIHLFLTSG